MKKIQICFICVLVFFLSCQTVLAKGSVSAEEWFERGMKYEKQNVYDEAVKMYTNAIEINDKYVEAYFRRGKMYFLQHPSNCIEAIRDYTKVVELAPEYADAYYQRGLLYLYKIDNEKATADMETAAGLGHKKAQKWLNPKPEEEKIKYIDLSNYIPSKKEPMVHFDFNRAEIKAPYYSLLDEIGRVLKENLAKAKIVVAGYADSMGTEKYNKDLSLRRAKAVQEYLSERHGIALKRIIMKGYGENSPIASNESEEGRTLNRRVEMLGVEGL